MKLPVYTQDGKSSGSDVEVSDVVFGIEPNEHAMYLAVKVQRARMRQGTHSSKNRSAVKGGGRKPWRQKGRGAARAGTIRSPLWRHGGTIFGPIPHEYRMRVPVKVNRLARASALSIRVSEDALRIVEDFSFDSPKTKNLLGVLKSFELDTNKVLILTAGLDRDMVKSAENLPGCTIRVGSEASTYDMLNHRVILVHKGALEPITEVLSGR